MWKVFAAPLFLGEASVLAAEAVTLCQEGRGDICIQSYIFYLQPVGAASCRYKEWPGSWSVSL